MSRADGGRCSVARSARTFPPQLNLEARASRAEILSSQDLGPTFTRIFCPERAVGSQDSSAPSGNLDHGPGDARCGGRRGASAGSAAASAAYSGRLGHEVLLLEAYADQDVAEAQRREEQAADRPSSACAGATKKPIIVGVPRQAIGQRHGNDGADADRPHRYRVTLAQAEHSRRRGVAPEHRQRLQPPQREEHQDRPRGSRHRPPPHTTVGIGSPLPEAPAPARPTNMQHVRRPARTSARTSRVQRRLNAGRAITPRSKGRTRAGADVDPPLRPRGSPAASAVDRARHHDVARERDAVADDTQEQEVADDAVAEGDAGACSRPGGEPVRRFCRGHAPASVERSDVGGNHPTCRTATDALESSGGAAAAVDPDRRRRGDRLRDRGSREAAPLRRRLAQPPRAPAGPSRPSASCSRAWRGAGPWCATTRPGSGLSERAAALGAVHRPGARRRRGGAGGRPGVYRTDIVASLLGVPLMIVWAASSPRHGRAPPAVRRVGARVFDLGDPQVARPRRGPRGRSVGAGRRRADRHLRAGCLSRDPRRPQRLSKREASSPEHRRRPPAPVLPGSTSPSRSDGCGRRPSSCTARRDRAAPLCPGAPHRRGDPGRTHRGGARALPHPLRPVDSGRARGHHRSFLGLPALPPTSAPALTRRQQEVAALVFGGSDQPSRSASGSGIEERSAEGHLERIRLRLGVPFPRPGRPPGGSPRTRREPCPPRLRGCRLDLG